MLDRRGVDVAAIGSSERQEADLPKLGIALLQSEQRELPDIANDIP